jgi:glycosyltransferase involved in cell wall biosynthesis
MIRGRSISKTGCAALLKQKRPPRNWKHQLRGCNEDGKKMAIERTSDRCGGIERVVGELAQRLSRDHDAEVQVWSGTLGHAQTCDWEGVHVRTYSTSRRVGYASVKLFSDLKRSAQNFDVIHAHGSSTLVPLMGALAASGTPLVISPYFHPQASNKLLAIVKPLFENTVDTFVLRKARKIICISETEAELVYKRFPNTSTVSIIYSGVNAEEIQSAKPCEFDGQLILYVGRLVRYKNVHRVIEAVAYLPQRFTFYIIDEGPYRNHLETQIRDRGLSHRVKLLDVCSDATLFHG